MVSILRYRSRVKWSNPVKRVVSSSHMGAIANKNGTFGSPSTTVANFFNLQCSSQIDKKKTRPTNWPVTLHLSKDRIYSYLPTPLPGQDVAQGQFEAELNRFEFRVFLLLDYLPEEPRLPYYLLTAGGRIIGFIPFPRVLVLCEMQSVSSRIWTRVTVSISNDENHYTSVTSVHIQKYKRCA